MTTPSAEGSTFNLAEERAGPIVAEINNAMVPAQVALESLRSEAKGLQRRA